MISEIYLGVDVYLGGGDLSSIAFPLKTCSPMVVFNFLPYFFSGKALTVGEMDIVPTANASTTIIFYQISFYHFPAVSGNASFSY